MTNRPNSTQQNAIYRHHQTDSKRSGGIERHITKLNAAAVYNETELSGITNHHQPTERVSMKLTHEEIKSRYANISGSAHCVCEFATSMVGGQPATDDALHSFIQHYLHLEGTDADSAFSRIKGEEIGERKTDNCAGELDEKLTYGVNCIRRTTHGPWIGNWMIQASIKQAASRIGLFQKARGSKGDMSEAALVSATGISLLEPDRIDRIYLINGAGPAQTYWEKFQGKVSTPKGGMSIVHDSECVASGTRFEFTFQFLPTKIKETDIADILGVFQNCGLGSCRSLGHGRINVITADISM
jgi:hypothetical protein